MTAYTGGSVLLPCYCTDLHTKPEGFIWERDITNRDTWEEISSESGQYRDRFQLVNGHSPGNLSLLISHLTEEDGGVYRCNVKEKGHVFIKLTVKGCILEKGSEMLSITAHTGGSVLLPCYCTDLHTTPETFTWKKFDTNRSTWQEISNESGQYSTRVQLFNDHSPGNLSLLISHLTEKDGGDYSCRVMNNGSKYIRLTVEEAPATKLTPTLSRNIQTSVEPTATISSQTGNSPLTNARAEPPQSLPFVPFGLVTVIILHIIVAVVYHTKRNKGTNCTIIAVPLLVLYV
uniref:Ig-like domain-containing protein n=1 Tax=Pygocentrus nattereri TaxID=42514 RepID=A0AAR2IXW6_PYGNA